MSDDFVTDVVHVVEKHRVEDGHPDMSPSHETWTEIKDKPERISEDTAEFLWHEFGIEAKEEGIEVVKDE